MFYIEKLKKGHVWKRIFYERLTEPLHLNLLSIPVAMFGGFRARVEFDLIFRPQHAYGILASADLARSIGIDRVTLIEFGVASGAGLLNLCKISEAVTKLTGVRFRIFGFDSGAGLPLPKSYKDHPDLYQLGDYPMDFGKLQRALPSNCQLILGELSTTVGSFVAKLDKDAPVGFCSIDVDYYSSTVDALDVLKGPSEYYLPRVQVYVDDVQLESHNSWCGERLAINEFNQSQEMRKIEHHAFFRGSRLFRNANWIDHMMTLHVLDHPMRVTPPQRAQQAVLANPYLS